MASGSVPTDISNEADELEHDFDTYLDTSCVVCTKFNEKNSEAAFQCKQCNANLCIICAEQHGNNEKTQKHNLTNLSNIESAEKSSISIASSLPDTLSIAAFSLYSASLYSSGPYLDTKCAVCVDNEKFHVEAIRRCEECQKSFCAKCLRRHNRTKTMKDHKLNDMGGMRAEEQVKEMKYRKFINDSYFNKTCSFCSQDGKNVIASGYCKECDRPLCYTCLRWHNKFETEKEHTIIKINEKLVDEMQLVIYTQDASCPCPEHVNENIDKYCQDCGQVCCNACIEDIHRNCETYQPIISISEAAKCVTICRDIDVTKMNKEIDKLNKMKELLCEDLSKLDTQHENILLEMKSNRELIDQHLDKLEDELKEKLHLHLYESTNKIKLGIEEIEKTLEKLEKHRTELQTMDLNNKTRLFINQNQVESIDCWSLKLKMKKIIGVESLDYVLDNKIVNTVLELQHIGKYYPDTFELSASCRILKLNETKNKKTSCYLSNGSVILSDYYDKTITLLNISSKTPIQDQKLPNSPFSVCSSNHNEIVIQLKHNKIQLANVKGNKITLTTSFKVCKDIFIICRMTLQRDKIYILFKQRWEEFLYINMYGKSGVLMGAFTLKLGDNCIKCSEELILASDDNNVYITNVNYDEDYLNDGVIIYTINEDNGTLEVLVETNFRCITFICPAGNSSLIISGERIDRQTVSQLINIKTRKKLLIKIYESGHCKLIFDKNNSNLIALDIEKETVNVYNVSYLFKQLIE